MPSVGVDVPIRIAIEEEESIVSIVLANGQSCGRSHEQVPNTMSRVTGRDDIAIDNRIFEHPSAIEIGRWWKHCLVSGAGQVLLVADRPATKGAGLPIRQRPNPSL